MNVYDSLQKIENTATAKKIEEFSKKAELYADQGCDERSIAELIQIDGCDTDLSKRIANAIVEKYPVMFNIDNPPASYQDVKDNVEKTIKEASVEKLDKYFSKFANKEMKNIVHKIVEARSMNSPMIMRSIISDEIEPYVNGIIATNNALARDEKFAAVREEKEVYEQDLFGIWPVDLIKKRASIEKADAAFLRRAKIKPGDNISFI